MYSELQIKVAPEEAGHAEYIKKVAAQQLGVEIGRVKHVDVIRRSVDARQKKILLCLTVGVHVDAIEEREPVFVPEYEDVSGKERVLIVGAGPAGLFAALRLIERGYCPVILERGKCVEERKGDLNRLYKTGVVDEDSNFGFGEGGAGTFSDGKLYTRSKKRGNVRRILEILVHHGAGRRILIDAHPHVGTDKLPDIIANIRKSIVSFGGEVHFNTRVTELLIEKESVCGVLAGDKLFSARHVILATGHSARDVYRMLERKGILLEPKDFAVGLRVEHPQHEIDNMQYHTRNGRGEHLPAAEYALTTNIDGRGVYSFCMCPGGIVVPAATGPEQQVVNGMSSSGRNTPWANSAIVTAVGEKELQALGYRGIFAGMDFQESIEKQAFEAGGSSLHAPAQVLTDFLCDRYSNFFPKVSYKPGIKSSLIGEWMPQLLTERLKKGLQYFGQRSKGFVTEKAVLMGVESRTSSPLRIPRKSEHPEHVQIGGLYPCGEGAGYAGGIVSAAMDGEYCAEAVH